MILFYQLFSMLLKAFAISIIFITFFLQHTSAQFIYKNGSFTTGPYAQNGTLAPGETRFSELQQSSIAPLIANVALGFPAYHSDSLGFHFALADDFTVPANEVWTIHSCSFYVYNYKVENTQAPVSALRLRIWNGNPELASSQIIFGDLNINRLISNSDSATFRIHNTLFKDSIFTNRNIWKITANADVKLTAGNYWIEWQSVANDQVEHFYPSNTIPMKRTEAVWNAKIHDIINNAWYAAVDIGGPDSISTSDVSQDFPFEIVYDKQILPAQEVWVSPTLATSKVTLHFSEAESFSTYIKLVNGEGRTLQVVSNLLIPSGLYEYSIPVNSLTSGRYYILIKLKSGKTKTLTFIKM